MTSWRPTLLLALAVVLVIGGVTLKLARYGETDTGHRDAAVNQLTRFVQKHGWSADPKVPVEYAGSLTIFTFAKTGCDQPFRVALLGSTDGLDSYLRRRFGNNIYYVQHGVRRDRPSMMQYHLNVAGAIVRQTFGGSTEIRPAIFAVVPPEPMQNTSCAVPEMSNWQ